MTAGSPFCQRHYTLAQIASVPASQFTANSESLKRKKKNATPEKEKRSKSHADSTSTFASFNGQAFICMSTGVLLGKERLTPKSQADISCNNNKKCINFRNPRCKHICR
jgi:hypothetical protein